MNKFLKYTLDLNLIFAAIILGMFFLLPGLGLSIQVSTAVLATAILAIVIWNDSDSKRNMLIKNGVGVSEVSFSSKPRFEKVYIWLDRLIYPAAFLIFYYIFGSTIAVIIAIIVLIAWAKVKYSVRDFLKKKIA